MSSTMWNKFLPLFMIPNLWVNTVKNNAGITDEKGNVFLMQEKKVQNKSSFSFVPFLQKSSLLQKFSYEDNVILYDFFHPKSEKHYVDLVRDNGDYYRMKLNDTTLYQDIYKNMYRRYNHFGDALFCDIETKTCHYEKDSKRENTIFYQYMQCMNELQFSVDSNNRLSIQQFCKDTVLYSVETDINVTFFHVEEGVFNLYYVFLKDEQENLHVYTFRYENNRIFYKMKSLVPLQSCLDFYIAHPYIFVYVNKDRVNIYHVDMLQSKFFLKPPSCIQNEDKIFFLRKKLFFYKNSMARNIPYSCLQHFLN